MSDIKWTQEQIENLCIEYCAKCGVVFNSPVVINGRLKSTLGRCFWKKNSFSDRLVPYKIDISKQLLETAEDESIIDVIKHECAHYVTISLTGKDHKHDKVFKKYCFEIGTNNTEPHLKVQRKTSYSLDKVYKYTFYCQKCGEFVCGRHRTCNLTKNINFYFSNCCKAPLNLQINWQPIEKGELL